MLRRIWESHIAFAIVITAIAIVGVIPVLKIDFGCVDAAETIYHVREIASGRIPYRDIFNHHFMGYLLPLYVANFIVPFTPNGFWVWVVVSQIAAAGLAYLTVTELSSPRIGRLAALLTVTIGWFPNWEGNLFQNQAIYLPYIWLALLTLVRANNRHSEAYWLLAGISFGFISTLDQRLLMLNILPIISLFTISRKTSCTSVAYLMGGVLVFPLAWALYLTYHSAIQDLWFQTVHFALFHRNSTLGTSLTARLSSLAVHASSAHPIELIFFTLGTLSIFSSDTQRNTKILVLGLMFANLIAVILGGRNYINYLLFLSPVIILILALSWETCGIFCTLVSNAYKAGLVTLIVTALSLPLIRQYKFDQVQFEPQDQTLKELVAFANSHKGGKTDFLVWGYLPQFYLLTDTLSPFADLSVLSVIGSNFSADLNISQNTEPGMTSKFSQLLKHHPPRYFIEYSVKVGSVLADPEFFARRTLPSVPYPQASLALEQNAVTAGTVTSRYRSIQNIENIYDRAALYTLVDSTS